LLGVPAAAFFDLDRTLLRGASGPVISEALRASGVLSDRGVPGEGLLYQVFDLVGETRPSMILTRMAARFAKGWHQDLVQAAGEKAAEQLAGAVQPFARPLIDDHRAAGRRLVLATTTPDDMIRPLADRLGFDDVVATRYGLDGDGRYDGTIDGEFVWGRGKLRAVRDWAERHRVTLGDSWAYSDSYYDAPLLGAVGHPVAVNPDPRMLGVALVRRWPVVHLDVPAGVPKLPLLGIEPQRLLQMLAWPELLPWVRFDIDGVERIPAAGPAILAANHRSYFDPLALGMTLARRGRAVRFLGKREVFDAPVVGRGGGGSRRGGVGGDTPPGDHPPRPGILRSRAEGPLGCRPPGRGDAGSRGAHRAVGHGEGVATVGAAAPHLEHHEPADRHDQGRRSRRAQVPLGAGRHPADHGRHRGPASCRGAAPPSADRRRARAHLSTRSPGGLARLAAAQRLSRARGDGPTGPAPASWPL
jgi:putative phosphoserine phosphatase/1-acylglycerol-3-phosphate O-acyltransferase